MPRPGLQQKRAAAAVSQASQAEPNQPIRAIQPQGRIQSLSLGGRSPCRAPLPSPPPIPPLPPSFPPYPFPSLPSLSFPSLLPFPFPLPLLPSLPLPSPPLQEGVRGPPPENFEIPDCCRRVLAHSGMQKGVCKVCVFRSRYENVFWPQSRGRSPPPPVDPPLSSRLAAHAAGRPDVLDRRQTASSLNAPGRGHNNLCLMYEVVLIAFIYY